ncbi:MAG: alkaline phosphatase family protein [Myxococcaceae bacterium]|nr:alkaline phosphatase family protein [Myxococcaceae bacterium]
MTNRALLAAACLSATAAWAKPPKLTLVISVDSMGTDVFQRMRPRFKAGFSTLLTQGAYFPSARYEYAETVTAAGHATLSTGANPWRHGIASNKVLNRATGKLEPVFYDPGHPVLEAPPGVDDSSPANLLSESVADKVKLATAGAGKAVSIAGKARAAIALGGHLGAAWWFNEPTGRFVTGTYYAKEPPAWVKAFNDKKNADAYHAKAWELLAPAKEYQGEDERPGESDWYGMGKKFPHPLNGGLPAPGGASYSALASSPFFNDVEVAFAKAAIDGEQLGKDDVPDLLAVSFSAPDRTYHLYGPYSWEVQDGYLRLDKAIGELLAAAEKAAGGKANLAVVVSADHGGADIPEGWAARGLDGVRMSPKALGEGLSKELAAKFGGAALVSAIEEIDVYLDAKVMADKKLDPAAVRRAAAAWLSKQPDTALAVARDDLFEHDTTPGLLRTVQLDYLAERSGDVFLVLKPYHVSEVEPGGTSHGQPYLYDSEVPVILYGRGVKAGVYPSAIKVTDVAPTVSALMEVGTPSSAEGSARGEALALPPR